MQTQYFADANYYCKPALIGIDTQNKPFFNQNTTSCYETVFIPFFSINVVSFAYRQ